MDPIFLNNRPADVKLRVTELIEFNEKDLYPTYFVSPPPGAVKIYEVNNGYLLNVDEELVKETLDLREAMIYPVVE